jgi:hypothetical protein
MREAVLTDVAGDESLSLLGARTHRDDRLAGVDADPHLQAEVGVGLVQLRDRVEDAEPDSHCALGVVLVGDGGTEDGHDRVPDELLHGAVVALDLLPQAGVVGTDAGAHVLRVLPLGRGSETHEIAEENRHDLPLLEQGRRCYFSERSAALVAELCPLRVLLAAARADQHEPSLGHQFRDKPATRRFGEPVSQAGPPSM